MKLFQRTALVFAMILGIGATSVQAATYDVTFTGNTDSSVNFFTKIETDLSDLVISMTGFVNGTDTILGVIPTSSPLNGVTWNFDNLFGATAPYVNNNGILFNTASGLTLNLYRDGDLFRTSFKPGTDQQFLPGPDGKLDVSAVPLPASGLALILGVLALVGLGVMRRRNSVGHSSFGTFA